MTTFTGQLLEYPYISIDRFNKENLLSSAYFLSHCHKDHIEGLLESPFLERLKTGWPNIKLYASDTTRNLMLCDDEMKELVDHVVGLPVHQPHFLTINIEKEKVITEENITVTLVSAGHCVGSVMFLYEGKNGKVLYTGDFRLGETEIKKVSCFSTSESVASIKSVYVDTTFCFPQIPNLPSREQTKDCLIEIIDRWIKLGSHHIVHLKCKGRYGYEYIMKEVSKHFSMKIHVNKWRLRMSEKLPNMLKHFTTNPTQTQIHSCYFGKGSNNSIHHLPCGVKIIDGQKVKMITIVPSSLYFLQSNKIPQDGKMWIASQKLWRVFHSMHASYNEIREVVGYLKPENIYPCVPPVDCQNIITAYNRLQDLRTSYTSNSEHSDSSQGNAVTDKKVLKKANWSKDLQNEHLLSPRSVSAHYASIGISDDRPMKSPPPVRKRRRKSRVSDKVPLTFVDERREIKHVNMSTEDHELKERLTKRMVIDDLHNIIQQQGKVSINICSNETPNYSKTNDEQVSCVAGAVGSQQQHDGNIVSGINSTKHSLTWKESTNKNKQCDSEVIYDEINEPINCSEDIFESRDDIQQCSSPLSSLEIKHTAYSWSTDSEDSIDVDATATVIDKDSNRCNMNKIKDQNNSAALKNEDDIENILFNNKEQNDKVVLKAGEDATNDLLKNEDQQKRKMLKSQTQDFLSNTLEPSTSHHVYKPQTILENIKGVSDTLQNDNKIKVEIIDLVSDDDEEDSENEDSDRTLSFNETPDNSQVF